jgi:hypothetical protein
MISETQPKQHRKRNPTALAWPERGDQNPNDIYRSVGHALTQWGYVETAFARLFSALIALDRDSHTARRAYGVVRTSEGRLQMMRAASDAYLNVFPNAEIQGKLHKVIGDAQRLVGARNEVAHGVVGPFYSTVDEPFRQREEYALFPSFEDSSKRSVTETPYFCYTANDIDRFAEEFASLAPKVTENTVEIIDIARHRE